MHHNKTKFQTVYLPIYESFEQGSIIVGATAAATTTSGVGFGTPASTSTGFGLSGGLKLGELSYLRHATKCLTIDT